MAAGRAVVVSDGGGVSELIKPEHDALTHHPGDAQELLRQLQRLVADPALRRRLGEAARLAALERFNPTRVSRQMLELYSRFDRAAAA